MRQGIHPEPALIYVHLPKTGGTTLRTILEHLYPEDARYVIGGELQGPRYLKSFSELSDEAKRPVKVLIGHIPFGLHEHMPQPCLYFTLLRDPVQRLISLYYYILQEPHHRLHESLTSRETSLKEFVSSRMIADVDNGQTRLLSGIQGLELPSPQQVLTSDHLEVAKENLQRHFIVGLTEHFDESVELLSRAFGWQVPHYDRINVTRERPAEAELSSDTLDTIAQFNQLDMQLYDFAREQFFEQLRQVFSGEEEGQAQRLARLAYSHEAGLSARAYVGGMWEEIGRLQFDFLLQQGLQPHHRLLDIGCGNLRAGIHLARYLDAGNYYGVEKERWLLDAALSFEMPQSGVSTESVHLAEREDFDFSVFGVEFDFALAQSVFVHLSLDAILKCLINVERVLKDDGAFYATFFEAENGQVAREPITHIPGDVTTYPDQDPFHHTFGVFEKLASLASLQVRYLGQWHHPRDQMMMVFTRNHKLYN